MREHSWLQGLRVPSSETSGFGFSAFRHAQTSAKVRPDTSSDPVVVQVGVLKVVVQVGVLKFPT